MAASTSRSASKPESSPSIARPRFQKLRPIRPTLDPLTALENLHFDLGRIEALAFAANEALARIPRASTVEGRDAMRRLDHFVTLFAEEAVVVLADADGAVEEISRHLSAEHPRR